MKYHDRLSVYLTLTTAVMLALALIVIDLIATC